MKLLIINVLVFRYSVLQCKYILKDYVLKHNFTLISWDKWSSFIYKEKGK